MRLLNLSEEKNQTFPKFLMAVLIVGMLQACSSSGGDSDADNSDASTDEPSGTMTDAAATDVPSSLPDASSAVMFEFSMDAVTGGTTTAQAQLFEPLGETPDGGYPLVVWAHGTTGIANSCAPSLSFTIFGNDVVVNSLLAAGYAVLAPDYEGFGTPSVHPYYQRDSHANSVLAAIPAAHEISELTDEWAMVGHSQGGHVVLAAARAEQDPTFPLQAVVALAPGTDLEPLSDRAFEAIDLAIANQNFDEAGNRIFFLNVNGGFVANGFQAADPSFDPATLFGDDVANLVAIAPEENTCGIFAVEVGDALNEHFDAGGALEDFAGLRRDWFTEPALVGPLAQNALNDEAQDTPLLVVQGDMDTQIPDAATTDFVNLQMSLGTDVDYELISGADHIDVAEGDFGIALDWLVEQFPPQ